MGITAIIKPTHSCNFSCKYCYIDSNAESGLMTEETLNNLVEQLTYVNSLIGEKSHFIWHGGEPFLMQLSFYEKAVHFQKTHRNSVENGFQSNGSLINTEIIDFCKKHHFQLGLSLDGPPEINDLTRQYKNGSGTSKEVLNAIQQAKQAGIGGGVITILNKHNIKRIAELYVFFKREKINVKVNPLIKSGNAINNYEDLAISSTEYGNAMIQLFELWFNDDESKISIEPFNEIVGNLLTGNPQGCNFSKSCQEHYVSIGPQGDVYPCGRFDGISEYKLGNINTNSLRDMLNSEKRLLLLSRKTESFKDCVVCDYQRICNAGCMHNAYMQSGNVFSKDFYCGGYKLLFSHIEKKITEEIKETTCCGGNKK